MPAILLTAFRPLYNRANSAPASEGSTSFRYLSTLPGHGSRNEGTGRCAINGSMSGESPYSASDLARFPGSNQNSQVPAQSGGNRKRVDRQHRHIKAADPNPHS